MSNKSIYRSFVMITLSIGLVGSVAYAQNVTNPNVQGAGEISAASVYQSNQVNIYDLNDIECMKQLKADAKELLGKNEKERKLAVEAAGDRELVGKLRSVFIVPQLQALRLLVDNRVPDGDVPPPLAVSKFDCSPDEPGYAALLAEHNQQLQARDQRRLMRELVRMRNEITDNILGYYSNAPFNNTEFERLTADILKDKDVVTGLNAKLKSRLEKRSDVSIKDNQMKD